MKNAFSRIGQRCASTLVKGSIVTTLLTGALCAGTVNPVTVTLPKAVTVGSTTVPSGEYILTNLDMNDGNAWFVLRTDNGAAVAALRAQKIEAPASGKTELTIEKSGDAWRLDKLFIHGGDTGYQFTDQK